MTGFIIALLLLGLYWTLLYRGVSLAVFTGVTAAVVVALAATGLIMTLGIKPTHPSTAYGYLAPGEALSEPGANRLSRFVEKPKLDIAEIGMARPVATATAALLEGGMAVLVVGRSLLRVLEAVIGDADRLEFRLALAASRIAVRVNLHGQLAVGLLDLVVAGATRDPENVVKIRFRHVVGP